MFDHIIQEEWQNLKKSPFTAAVAVIVGFMLATGFWLWYYKDRIDVLQQNVVRYRMAAGLDKPNPKTTLTELTNTELKRKANSLAERIREIMAIHTDQMKAINIDPRNTADAAQYNARVDNEVQRALRQLEPVRVDAIMVNDELRARTPPRVLEKLVDTTPSFRSADDPKALVTMHRLNVHTLSQFAPFALSFAGLLANELEELSKLQLEKLEPCAC